MTANDDDFLGRREAARTRLDGLAGARDGDPAERGAWFQAVYDSAGDDPAAVPWADLAPKDVLVDWLVRHPGEGRRALDIGCGLGDNAEAIAAAGYRTSAFDLAPGAIEWARKRFPDSPVDYRVGDLFALPTDWVGNFGLVHECYTIQALDDPLRSQAFAAIAALLAPGGTLLVITRTRAEGCAADGPPWPLMPSELVRFEALGLERVSATPYTVERPGRRIPHVLAEFRRPG
ncbi:class I SAM-dependent methyltransferase [Polymorphum gilvum]|uniref:Thiopurine S-methyltransferase superfamily n=1 Tax=Polymorphum gilvum (strain LMG 25793 / CGMCC 1.9160 / SL003B-26A1) TaxID=991905 RepID=F2J1L4_POLGS|nr:class I SAM-dependent methyltransferase [Polymorphum gilvum]ADZ70815.1 Thiopurine S-methyltransferase superfamily [Polymorphum gilvum SL003B-26A1]